MTSLPRPLGVPDLTYAQEVSLGGDVRLLHRTAHTRGDTLVYLPTVGVLATGDVLDDLPFGGHGYPRTWLRTLEELEELDFEVIVPGHGRVRRGKDHLRLVRDMYRSMLEQVNAAVSRELKLEATQKEVDLSRFRETLVADDAVAEQAWEAFIPATIERAWLEARDELPTDAR